MRVTFSNRFVYQFRKLPTSLQTKFNKQLGFLLTNLHHPSLRAKKYSETKDIWQARVDSHYRFYFKVEGDIYQILSVISHPKWV